MSLDLSSCLRQFCSPLRGLFRFVPSLAENDYIGFFIPLLRALGEVQQLQNVYDLGRAIKVNVLLYL